MGKLKNTIHLLDCPQIKDRLQPTRIKREYKLDSKLHPLTLKTFNTGYNLNNYKLPDIKAACKLNKLPVSGTKPILIGRLTNFFIRVNAATIVQKYIRRRFILRWINVHGPAFNDITKCVNQTDFVSMEPITQIDRRFLYSYKDTKDFIYAFDITSLIQTLQVNSVIVNPYTREELTKTQHNDIIFMYNMSRCIFDVFHKENPHYFNSPCITNPRMSSIILNYIASQIRDSITDESNVVSSYTNYRPNVYQSSLLNANNYTRYNQINNIRRQPIDIRVRDVFIEIDRLGNYTNQEWFNNLSHINYANLYRLLYNIWNFRAGIPPNTKLLICPFHSPFDGIFPREIRHDELTLEELKISCLIVFENMVYSGVDDEYRKIGAFHALSALTVVSRSARASMPWLYESVI
jgi:hypothetical protein